MIRTRSTRLDISSSYRLIRAAADQPRPQGLYAPGSTFKTLTLLAALDSGTASLDNMYTKDEALNYVINGEPIRWDDYYAGAWRSGAMSLPSPCR